MCHYFTWCLSSVATAGIHFSWLSLVMVCVCLWTPCVCASMIIILNGNHSNKFFFTDSRCVASTAIQESKRSKSKPKCIPITQTHITQTDSLLVNRLVQSAFSSHRHDWHQVIHWVMYMMPAVFIVESSVYRWTRTMEIATILCYLNLRINKYCILSMSETLWYENL